ncbi:MAG: hypothetical protein ACI9WU_003354 [Myxococcota bacterium]|jgi:hypothetical protein
MRRQARGRLQWPLRLQPSLEFVGRGDRQVCEAVVEIRDERLCAWVVGPKTEVGALRAELSRLLPRWMVPESIVMQPALPRTSTGKIDRRSLLSPLAVPPGAGAGARPRTGIESEVESQWAQVLDLPEIPVDVDFFTLGGTSLRAVRLCAAIRDRLGHDLPLSELFAGRTIREIARRMTLRQTARPGSARLVRLVEGGSKRPLLLVVPPGGRADALRALAANVDPNRPVYACELPAIGGDETRDFEQAGKLATAVLRGADHVVLLDSNPPGCRPAELSVPPARRLGGFAAHLGIGQALAAGALDQADVDTGLRAIHTAAQGSGGSLSDSSLEEFRGLFAHFHEAGDASWAALCGWQPNAARVTAYLIVATQHGPRTVDMVSGWPAVQGLVVEVSGVPASHDSMLTRYSQATASAQDARLSAIGDGSQT